MPRLLIGVAKSGSLVMRTSLMRVLVTVFLVLVFVRRLLGFSILNPTVAVRVGLGLSVFQAGRCGSSSS